MCENTHSVGALEGVSRETLDILKAYCSEVVRWNRKINLVSRSTETELWSRHLLDSAQLSHLLSDQPQYWLDLGSGAGFPGMVLAILARESAPDTSFTLVESDKRKAAFLTAMSGLTEAKVRVLAERIEHIENEVYNIISARALTNLRQLLVYSERFAGRETVLAFPKGLSFEEEVEDARLDWSFDLTIIDSKTSPEGRTLILRNVSRE